MRNDRISSAPGEVLLTIAEVARRLSVSKRTVTRWIERGELAVHRLGRSIRISEADLSAFLAQRRSR